MLRTPALPVEAYLQLGADPELLERALRGDGVPHPPGSWAARWLAEFSAAVRLASGSLWSSVARGGSDERPGTRARSALMRYLIRMATRPTPYGHFAGVALVGWGDATTLRLSAQGPVACEHVDGEWLADAMRELAADPTVLRTLRWVVGPAVFARGGRVLASPRGGPLGDGHPASVRASPLIATILRVARRPIAFELLLARVAAAHPQLDEGEIDDVLQQLREAAFLRVEVLPALTGAPLSNSAAWVLARRRHRAGAASARQVDLRWPLAGAEVHAEVARESAHAAELLMRLTPLRTGPAHLDEHRRRFLARYGHDRRVPILELLDPEIGIGWPAEGPLWGAPTAGSERTGRVLHELATAALSEGRLDLELTDELLGELTQDEAPQRYPPSMAINVLIGAASSAALDRGEFRLVVGPTIGARAAGRPLGRFASMLGDEALGLLRRAARHEEATDPEAIWAEIAYWPQIGRLANVMLRPAVRTHEIACSGAAGVSSARAIPLAELVVGATSERFFLEWPRAGRRVVPCTGHMLSYGGAPTPIRCLADIANDGRPMLAAFPWGAASELPVLPRVWRGRIVLSPARWRLHARMAVAASARGEGESFEDELRGWRERWRVPRRVNLGTEADKRLLLDLEAPAHQAELRRVLERLEPGVGVGAEEVLPELAETWVEGPGGRYVAEAVVPLVLRARAPRPVPGIPRRTATDDQRMATPGGAWLYMKAYGPRALQDRLLLAIAPLVDRAIEEEVVRAWHFVRYADPEPHLRLRFTGRPDALLHEALPRLTRHLRRAVRDGACTRLCIDTYEREVERYGGAAGMAIAERAFGIDTRAVVDLIALVHARRAPLDETLLAALSVDDFLRAFDDVGADVRGDGPPPADRHGAGPVFRALQPQLRRCLGDPAALRGSPGGRELSRILAERRLALGAVARDLRRADARGHIAVASSQLCATLVHLHLNRMIAPTARREAELLDLVRRTRVSLRRHPIDGDPELGPALTGA